VSSEEARRVLALMNELTSDPAYINGRRSFPRTLTREDATLIAGKLQDAVEDGTAVRARKAAEAGHPVACRAGCTSCCEQPIMVWLAEALRVVDHLQRPENVRVKEAFLAAYPAWREAMGDGIDRIAELTQADDRPAHVAAHLDLWRKRILCAFNRNGLCTIYAVRPVVCRNQHALDTPDHCRPDAAEPAARLELAPLDEFVGRAGALGSAMHHALGGPRRRTVALCQAVYEALTRGP
jgi:Fe-S-cluster containining protein